MRSCLPYLLYTFIDTNLHPFFKINRPCTVALRSTEHNSKISKLYDLDYIPLVSWSVCFPKQMLIYLPSQLAFIGQVKEDPQNPHFFLELYTLPFNIKN